MNKFDRAIIELRVLRQRVEALEAAAAAPPAPRKRAAAPRPTDSITEARNTRWARFVLLNAQFGRGRMTHLRFCVRYHLGHPSDFSKFLSSTCERRIAEGSAPAVRYNEALERAIAELETLRDTHAYRSHGIHLDSQSSSLRPH